MRALAVGAALALSANSAEAGLLDILFGQRPPAQQAYSAPEPGLSVAVAPPTPARTAKGSETASVRESPRASVLQTPMDISGDRDWFLRDVTLRRGDIIVRENGALVYEGSGHASRIKDFAKLSDTRLFSKRAKAKIEQLVAVPREDLVEIIANRAVKPTVIGGNGGVRPLAPGITGTIIADQAENTAKRR